MPGDVIQPAKSGRAACRSCKEKIAKGELRFGEVDYSFDPDGTFKWFHLACAARKLPAKLGEALAEYPDELPDKEALLAAMAEGQKGTAFPRGELAPSGRAACLGCQNKIAKGELRVAVEREVDTGSFVARRPGYLHPSCAVGSEHVAQYEDLLAAVRENSDLVPAKLDELAAALS
jgi:hypothetical protein